MRHEGLLFNDCLIPPIFPDHSSLRWCSTVQHPRRVCERATAVSHHEREKPSMRIASPPGLRRSPLQDSRTYCMYGTPTTVVGRTTHGGCVSQAMTITYLQVIVYDAFPYTIARPTGSFWSVNLLRCSGTTKWVDAIADSFVPENSSSSWPCYG